MIQIPYDTTIVICIAIELYRAIKEDSSIFWFTFSEKKEGSGRVLTLPFFIGYLPLMRKK